MKKNIVSILPLIIFLSACTYNIEGAKDNIAQTPAFLVERSKLNINLIGDEKANHKSTVLGVVCSAHSYNVMIGDDLKKSLSDIDVDAVLQSSSKSDIIVSLDSASSNIKCLYLGVASGECLGEVTLKGSVTKGASVPKVFKIEKTVLEKSLTCEGAVSSVKRASQMVAEDLIEIVKSYDK